MELLLSLLKMFHKHYFVDIARKTSEHFYAQKSCLRNIWVLFPALTRVPGRCFEVDYKNYGCDDCVWLKWHGDLHGYPDINPWEFKKYLDPEDLPVLGLW